MRQSIAEKLSVLNPLELVVTDESHKHAGHAGARPEGNTHFHVRLVSPDFVGISRVRRHQMIYALLKDEFAVGLHALALETYAPEEVLTC